MELPIKLGRKPDHMPDMAPSQPPDAPKEYFPTVFFEWDEPYNFPDGEFTMTVKARKIRTTDDKRNEKVSEEVELLEIVSVGGKKKKNAPRDDAGAALDRHKEDSGY